MTIQKSLQLFDLVNRNFKNEADARSFVTEIDELISSSFREEAAELPTRLDLDVVKTELLKEIAATNKEIIVINKEISAINKETAQLRIDLIKEIAITNKEMVQLRADLTLEIALVKADLTKQIETTRTDLTKQIESNRADLTKMINDTKIELIKWSFSFWITIVLLIIGTFFLKR